MRYLVIPVIYHSVFVMCLYNNLIHTCHSAAVTYEPYLLLNVAAWGWPFKVKTRFKTGKFFPDARNDQKCFDVNDDKTAFDGSAYRYHRKLIQEILRLQKTGCFSINTKKYVSDCQDPIKTLCSTLQFDTLKNITHLAKLKRITIWS